VWVGSTWVSYVDNANFRRFWGDFYSAASFFLRSFHCSNHDSSLSSIAVAAADLYSSQSQYASRAPPVPTHPPICLSSLSHMKEVCLPSHNLLRNDCVHSGVLSGRRHKCIYEAERNGWAAESTCWWFRGTSRRQPHTAPGMQWDPLGPDGEMLFDQVSILLGVQRWHARATQEPHELCRPQWTRYNNAANGRLATLHIGSMSLLPDHASEVNSTWTRGQDCVFVFECETKHFISCPQYSYATVSVVGKVITGMDIALISWSEI